MTILSKLLKEKLLSLNIKHSFAKVFLNLDFADIIQIAALLMDNSNWLKNLILIRILGKEGAEIFGKRVLADMVNDVNLVIIKYNGMIIYTYKPINKLKK